MIKYSIQTAINNFSHDTIFNVSFDQTRLENNYKTV